jgi:hypothetical protein
MSVGTPTSSTRLGVFEGTSVQNAFEPNYEKYDLLHIVNKSGHKVLVSVSYNGTVTLNPVSPTTSFILGRHGCSATAASIGSLASIFASAFPEASSGKTDYFDIFQVIEPNGGKCIYRLDYQGQAHQ